MKIISITSFYSEKELKEIGFKRVGENVLISRKASIYGAEEISIGNNVRIDDFCILSGSIYIHNNIHISAYSALYGGNAGIEMGDFATLSSRSIIFAKSDDYSGRYLTNPTVPEKYLNVVDGKVTLMNHVIVGSGSTILPNVTLETGVSVGAMSLVNRSLQEWNVYAGIPCKKIKERSKELLKLEQEYLEEKNGVKL